MISSSMRCVHGEWPAPGSVTLLREPGGLVLCLAGAEDAAVAWEFEQAGLLGVQAEVDDDVPPQVDSPTSGGPGRRPRADGVGTTLDTGRGICPSTIGGDRRLQPDGQGANSLHAWLRTLDRTPGDACSGQLNGTACVVSQDVFITEGTPEGLCARRMVPSPGSVSRIGRRATSIGQEVGRRGGVARPIPAQRIGGDVHEQFVEQLLAARRTLREAERALGSALAGRLRSSLEKLDDVIDGLREGFVGDEEQASAGDAGLAGRLLEVVMEVLPTLDSPPALHFSGMNVPLPRDVEADLRAVLRDTLTDVVQHTAATDVDVVVAATADRLTAQVTEHVTGPGAASCRSGLRDLHRRARDHDGAFSVEPRQQWYTRMTWTVPLGRLHTVH